MITVKAAKELFDNYRNGLYTDVKDEWICCENPQFWMPIEQLSLWVKWEDEINIKKQKLISELIWKTKI